MSDVNRCDALNNGVALVHFRSYSAIPITVLFALLYGHYFAIQTLVTVIGNNFLNLFYMVQTLVYFLPK